MGMTIDEAMANLSMYSVDEYGNAYTSTWYKGIDKDMEESFELAIETMRKYQKIEQIYQKWNAVNDFSYNQAMRKIGEVIEDGKID